MKRVSHGLSCIRYSPCCTMAMLIASRPLQHAAGPFLAAAASDVCGATHLATSKPQAATASVVAVDCLQAELFAKLRIECDAQQPVHRGVCGLTPLEQLLQLCGQQVGTVPVPGWSFPSAALCSLCCFAQRESALQAGLLDARAHSFNVPPFKQCTVAKTQDHIDALPSMDQLLGQHVDLAQLRKIGEGTYGEAFKAGDVVLKIVPMEGQLQVNEWLCMQQALDANDANNAFPSRLCSSGCTADQRRGTEARTGDLGRGRCGADPVQFAWRRRCRLRHWRKRHASSSCQCDFSFCGDVRCGGVHRKILARTVCRMAPLGQGAYLRQ